MTGKFAYGFLFGAIFGCCLTMVLLAPVLIGVTK